MQGWYPDPGGAPGRYRYWDGSSWSTETTDDPRAPAPRPAGAEPAGGSRPAARPRRRGPWIVLAIVVAVVIIIGVTVLFRGGSDRATPGEPSSTASGWDDSSPLPTATPSATPSPSRRPSQTASPRPTRSAAPPPEQVACPSMDQTPAARPADGRVHGGKLSFPMVQSYPQPEVDHQFSWMADVTSQTQQTEPGWISIFAAGEVQKSEDGFETAAQAAESSIQCAITEGWYTGFTGRKNLRNQTITVDGKKGWIVSAEIRVDRPDLSVDGDLLTFVAVADGRPDRLSIWAGMVPLGDTQRIAIHNRLLNQLTIG